METQIDAGLIVKHDQPVKVGIVMPVLSQFRLALEAIASVHTNHSWHPYIVPNWEMAWSVAKSWNWGVQWAIDEGCTHILVINDDILFSEWTIDALVDLLNSNPEAAMATGSNVRDSVEPSKVREMTTPENVSQAEHPDFSCFMITPKTWKLIGQFDEGFTPAYFEDNDYHHRIKEANLKAIATTAAPYYHYGSRTQNGGSSPVVPGPQFETNRDYYKQKWGGFPGAETFKEPFDGKREN